MLLYTVVVSTLIWVTQATPTGNHTCTGVVKHPVTVRVNVTEPVTYRTYTWCLKVPPRCSKYTVQLQDRVKIHTEMHNRTITVCCKGYVEIDYKCVPACPPQTECPFMHCNRTNHCYCTPGYTGLYCNEPCERGFWGEHCLKECDCPTGYTCHHLTGDCMIDDRPSKIRRTTVSDVEPSSTVSTTTEKQVITTERRTAPTTSTTTTTTTTTTPSTTTITTTPLPTTKATTSTTTMASSPTTSTTTMASSPTTSTAATPSTTTTTTITTTPSTVATTIATEPTTPTTITRPTISSTYTKLTTQATPEFSETMASTSEATTKEASTTVVTSTLASTTTSTTQASTQTSTTHASTPASTSTYSTPPTESISLSPSSTTQKSSTLIAETSEYIPSTIRTTEYTKPFRIFSESQTNPTVSTSVSVSTSPTTTESIVYSKTTSDSPETTTRRVTEPISTKVEMSTESSKDTFASQSSSPSMTTAAPSTSETTATSINLSTRPKPEIFTTLVDSTRKASSILDETTIAEKTSPKTTEVIPTTIEIETTRVTTENIVKEVVETKTTREESFENMPPMMVNRKKHISSPEKETERPVIKEVPLQSTTSSTTEATKADEGVHHFAPMVPFPHHTRTHKPPTTFSTSTTVQTVITVPTTTTTSTTPTTIGTTQITKSPLDFLQPFKTFDISNGDNSITSRPPNGDKITTQKSKETYIDNNKRLWEIFETGLNLKTTSSPIRTLPPIEITERPFEKYGDVEKPIKKSDKDSMIEVATVTTTLDEKETSAEMFSKQLKYKEKYQKKVKPKVYDVTTSPQETFGTSSTDYKIVKPAKYPKSSKIDAVEEQKMTEKEATTESTTPYRPSHTWYSHAREKAKIKEAMKSLKTTLFDLVKPTEAFDNESNDINLMQTAFTETSRNLREERNHKKGSIEANMINMTRPITRYVPQEITAGNEKDFTFYSNLIIIVGVSVLMLLTLVTLFWIRANKIKRNESVSPASSIVAYSTQSETVSPLMYETVYPLNGGPELMEAATFFCPTFTNHYAERINRELSELSYDHPPSRRPLKFNQYTEVSLDTNK